MPGEVVGLAGLHLGRIEKEARRVAKWGPAYEYEDLRNEGVVAVLEWIAANGPIDEALAYTVARHRMLTYARSLRLRRCKVKVDARLLTRLTGRAYDIAMRLDLEYAMGGLKPRHRRLVELSDVQDMTHAEAGAETGYSDRGVESTLYRVHKSIQGGLGPAYGEWSRKFRRKYQDKARQALVRRKAACIAVDPDAAPYVEVVLDTRSRREPKRKRTA